MHKRHPQTSNGSVLIRNTDKPNIHFDYQFTKHNGFIFLSSGYMAGLTNGFDMKSILHIIHTVY